MIKAIIVFAATVLLSGILSWIARGAYDQYFMMDGTFHVVSHSQESHDVRLKFPSGKIKAFSLNPGVAHNFKLKDTGEGAITVNIDGNDRDNVGYVTSYNSMIVLVIGGERTGFSQFFISSKLPAY